MCLSQPNLQCVDANEDNGEAVGDLHLHVEEDKERNGKKGNDDHRNDGQARRNAAALAALLVQFVVATLALDKGEWVSASSSLVADTFFPTCAQTRPV